MFRNFFCFSFFLCFFLFYSSNSFSTVYINTDIFDLSRDSEVACFGTVREIKSTEVNERPVTQILFECEQPAKGEKGIYLYNFLNLSSQGGLKFSSLSFEQNPTFKSGQKYFLFLYPPHPLSHLTSPVGGEQGVFKYHSKNGLINEFKNQNLIPPSTSQFKQLSTRLNEIRSGEKVGLTVEEMIFLVRESQRAP